MSFELRLADARHNIECFIGSYDTDAPESAAELKEFVEEFILDLGDLIRVIEEAHAAQYPDLENLLEKADALLDEALTWACTSDGQPFESGELRSFAHSASRPLFGDKDISLRRGTSPFLTRRNDVPLPEVWPNTPHPHPSSTRCARFRSDIPDWSRVANENTHPLATSIFQARCEINSGRISHPWSSTMSEDGNLLAISSMSGWKNRIPYMTCYFINHSSQEESEYSDFLNKRTIKLDLASGPTQQLVVDGRQNLIATADYARIKTYSYALSTPQPQGASGEDIKPPPLKRVHTLNSNGFDGPLLIRSDGKFIRGGHNGNVAVWNMDQLDTHGEDGKQVIGKAMKKNEIETWRDDPEDIEPSTGNDPHITFRLPPLRTFNGQLGSPLSIGNWHEHPAQAGIMLCGPPEDSKTFHCHAIDLNAEGKTAARYLGHGGMVHGFSTSPGDLNVFLTYCEDGLARIFDVRSPLPVMTIQGTVDNEALSAAVLVHADGIPFVFTGSHRGEVVKLWDVRARALIYDLGTGNNAVTALDWDASHNALYATTASEHSGRYRRAIIPRSSAQGNSTAYNTNRVNYPPEDEKGADMDQYKRWPVSAFNEEGYFGYAWDAGGPRLYKYSFKANADTNRLPFYHGI